MENLENAIATAIRRAPWNKGKLTGAKPPLRPKHVWSIRSKLKVAGQIRDLAMFNLAMDSKLRGGDRVSIEVEDTAPHGVRRYLPGRVGIKVDGFAGRFGRPARRSERRLAGGEKENA